MLYGIYAALGGDDDKYKTMWASNAVYQLSALQTDLMQTTALGWSTFYKRRKQYVAPAERTINDMISFLQYAIIYPFETPKERIYQRGIYKGKEKVDVYFNKIVPLARQIQTQTHMGSMISYYQMYNPLLNLWGNKNSGN